MGNSMSFEGSLTLFSHHVLAMKVKNPWGKLGKEKVKIKCIQMLFLLHIKINKSNRFGTSSKNEIAIGISLPISDFSFYCYSPSSRHDIN